MAKTKQSSSVRFVVRTDADFVDDDLELIHGITSADIITALVNVLNATELVNTVTASGTAQTIPDPVTAGVTISDVTLTGNCTFTMPAVADGKSLTVRVRSGAGGFTGTFTSVKWPGGAAPVVSSGASKLDIFTFLSSSTAWSGAVFGQDLR